MLSVRLQRVGRKNDPSFRMVIIDSKRGVKSADYIEMVGSYNPRQKTVDVKADRIKHWISVGAKPTDTVHNILINQKVIEGKKVNPLGKKTPVVKTKDKVADEVKAVKDSPVDNDASASEKTKTPATEESASSAEAETPDEETPAEEKKGEPEATEEVKEETPVEEEKKEEEKTAPEPEAPKKEPKPESTSKVAEEPKEDDKKDKAEGEA